MDQWGLATGFGGGLGGAAIGAITSTLPSNIAFYVGSTVAGVVTKTAVSVMQWLFLKRLQPTFCKEGNVLLFLTLKVKYCRVADNRLILSSVNELSKQMNISPRSPDPDLAPPKTPTPEPYADPNTDPYTDPDPEPYADPNVEPYTDPEPEPYADPNVEPYTDPEPEPYADPNIGPYTNPN